MFTNKGQTDCWDIIEQSYLHLVKTYMNSKKI